MKVLNTVLAVLSCVVLPSTAATLDVNGRGQVLLFPFVTSEKGWDTYLGLNLDPSGGHVVRLRVMDPRDGLPLQTFNIYSSFGENWRAAVTVTEGGPVLRVTEGTCMIADTGEFGGAGTDFSLETSVAMLEAYSVTKVFGEYQLRFSDDPSLLTCAELAERFQPNGLWAANATIGFEDDSRFDGEISGYFDLVSVQTGLAAALPATAIKQFAADIAHTAPASAEPDMGSADPIAIVADGRTFVPPSGEGLDAIALLLSPSGAIDFPSPNAKVDVANDVITNRSIRADTDWIVSFPLRGYRPAGFENAMINGAPRVCEASTDIAQGEAYVESTFCSVLWRAWGSGASYQTASICISPSIPSRLRPLSCNAVNSVAFGDGQPVFFEESSEYQYTMPVIGEFSLEDVSLRVAYDPRTRWFKDGETYNPVIGFRATTFVNGTLAGGSVLANYMTMRPHSVQ